MATYVKGNAVENATSYELLEKSGSAYTSLAEASEINFELSALGLPEGEHTLVVKAKADGYADSDYSNEIIYSNAAVCTSYIGADVFCNTGIRIVEDATSEVGWKQTTSGTTSHATNLLPVTSDDEVWLQCVWTNFNSTKYICIGLYDSDETLVGVVAPADFGLDTTTGVNFQTPEGRVRIGDIESRDGISVAYIRFIAWNASSGGQTATEARIYSPA